VVEAAKEYIDEHFPLGPVPRPSTGARCSHGGEPVSSSEGIRSQEEDGGGSSRNIEGEADAWNAAAGGAAGKGGGGGSGLSTPWWENEEADSEVLRR